MLIQDQEIQFIPAFNQRLLRTMLKINPYIIKALRQSLQPNDGYIHPLDFIYGLPYLPLRPFTDQEQKTLPHVVWTSDVKWDPSSIDHKITDNNEWGDYYNDEGFTNDENPFDIYGDYIKTFNGNQHTLLAINKIDIIFNQHYLQH